MSDKSVAVMASTVSDEQRQAALLQAVGFDKLNPAMREMALAISERYSLDPMLRHLVMVEGKPYITRDGLLHVAHKSGVFDGIEVDQPALDADGKYWRTWATVYRKDMKRPFRYPGRYPATGGNAKYNEEMCIKVAEVMTLRRAFDVAAPVLEERWDGEMDEGERAEAAVVATVVDKIAARAAQIESGMASADPGGVAPVGIGTILAEMEEAGDIALVDADPPEPSITEPAAADATVADAVPEDAATVATVPETPPSAPDTVAGDGEDGVSLADFKALVKELGVPQDVVRAIARELYPDRSGFGDLAPRDLSAILDRVEMVAEQMAAAEDAKPAPPEPTPIRPVTGPTLCGAPSPYGDGKDCTLDAGHSGATHRHGVTSSW